MTELMSSILSLAFAVQMLRISVPYALAALGGVVSERSGVINIALEGKLLAGAFGAALAAYYSGSTMLAAACGALAGIVVGALYALVVVRLGGDQIVAGVAINLLTYGLTRYLLELFFDSTASSPTTVGIDTWVISSGLFWLVVALAVAVWLWLARTPFGLRLRAVGEHPVAAASLGVRVERVRWVAVLMAGALAGLGGAYLALTSRGFVAEMSGGRGYIALAAVIMASWRPLWACAACLLFGFAEALQLRLQTAGIAVPTELVQTLPYVLTMIALAGFIGRSRPPRALGAPYPPER